MVIDRSLCLVELVAADRHTSDVIKVGFFGGGGAALTARNFDGKGGRGSLERQERTADRARGVYKKPSIPSSL
jgi:predicted naringenin-chalcone synthase